MVAARWGREVVHKWLAEYKCPETDRECTHTLTHTRFSTELVPASIPGRKLQVQSQQAGK